MQQLLLPSPHILTTELERSLDALQLDRALELLQLLGGLQPLTPPQQALQVSLQQLLELVGPQFPTAHRHPLRLLEGWQRAQTHWPAPPYPPLLEKFARQIFARLGQIFARRSASQLWDEQPAGWYLARAGQLEAAIPALDARLQVEPLELSTRKLLALIHSSLGQEEPAARHWLALLLQAPLEVPQVTSLIGPSSASVLVPAKEEINLARKSSPTPSGREQSSREQSSQEQSSQEQSSREQSSQEQSSREQSSREQSSREQSSREQSSREQSIPDKTSPETMRDPLTQLAQQPLPLLSRLHAQVKEEGLPGDPRLWWAVVGLWSGIFQWEQLPGAPIWDGVGTPSGVGGIPGAVLSYLAMQHRARKPNHAQKWQGAEAQRQLQQLVPSLYRRFKSR